MSPLPVVFGKSPLLIYIPICIESLAQNAFGMIGIPCDICMVVPIRAYPPEVRKMDHQVYLGHGS